MTIRPLVAIGLAAAALAGCTTGPNLPPTEVLRYHLGEPLDRGTIGVEPLTGDGGPASLEFKTYAAAVQGELIRVGYPPAAPGATPQFVATVNITRTTQAGPRRESPVHIGIGGDSFSGGRHGGFGLGGGVGFPVGGGGRSTILISELSVTIKRRVDQSPVWEGRAHSFADLRRVSPDANVEAAKLARALFTGFPGLSGRTIEVK